MKSLILKDLYSMTGHLKSLLVTLGFLAVCLIPSSGAEGYLFSATLICCMQIVTTFAFDERCGWNAQAAVMPLSRRSIVLAKYVMLLILTLLGALGGLMAGLLGERLAGRPVSLEGMDSLLLYTLFAVSLCMIVGGTNIPLLFRFGAEKGRLLLLISLLIPAGAGGLAHLVMQLLGIAFTESLLRALMIASPLLALLWNAASCAVCCRLFEHMEL